MKTVKCIIGILSILISAVIALQTYALGLVTRMAGDLLGGLGIMTGTFMSAVFLIGGLIGFIACDVKTGGIIAGIIFLVGAAIGFYKMSQYVDLIVWAITAAVWCAAFLLSSVFMKQEPITAVETS